IMGRKTFAVLGRPLPERLNIILTHQAGFAAPGTMVAHSVDEALQIARDYLAEHGGDEVMVIGGAEVYRQFIGRCDRLYLTLVHATFPGTAFFPVEEVETRT